MATKNRRFQILLSDEEFEDLDKESKKRNLSASELVRVCLKNELTSTNTNDKLKAVHTLANLIDTK